MSLRPNFDIEIKTHLCLTAVSITTPAVGLRAERLVGMKPAPVAKCLIDVVGAQGFEPWTR
jgi:hypothetical protein